MGPYWKMSASVIGGLLVVALTVAVVGVEFRAGVSLHGLLCVSEMIDVCSPAPWGTESTGRWHATLGISPDFSGYFRRCGVEARVFLSGTLSVARLIAVDTKQTNDGTDIYLNVLRRMLALL